MADAVVAPWLLDAARARVGEFADQLRSGVDGDRPVPNLVWSVSELGQHVACLPAFWSELHEGGDTFDLPDDFAAYSDHQRISRITETDPATLADVIEHEMEAYLQRLAAGDIDPWLYGRQTTPSNMCGSMIEECVLHGRDLAAVTGVTPPTLTPREALVIVEAMMIITSPFVDPAKASAQPDGVYHVSFRGGRDFTWTKSGDALEIVPGRPSKPDARLNADPVAFVMTSLGRMSNARAGLTGKIVAHGRRPWRFVGLGGIAVDGV